MLTADLLPVRVVKGEVRPRYLDPGNEALQALAARLIEVFTAHVGRSRRELEEELGELLGTGTDFLLHRGLAKLLLDRSTFETVAVTDPEALRQQVFASAAAAYRRVGDPEEGPDRGFDREAVLAPLAAAAGMTSGDLERCLYADLKEEQILESWKPCLPSWLLDRYNVALAQGVLLRATELTLHFQAPDATSQRALFRKIKFFQLLHRSEKLSSGGYRVHLDGPLSLFQSSQKYGLQMASFLPTLLHFAPWTLEASLLWGKKRQARSFSISSETGLHPISRLTGQWQPEELAWFPEQFTRLATEWELESDPELLDLEGQGVLVPDFVFRHRPSGLRVFLEVLGYWRKGVVDSRLQQLRRHGPENLILALSKQLAAGREELEQLPGEVLVFRTVPVARRVLAALERLRVRRQSR